MKNVKGFSLIELLVVVAIIGVLAAAGVVGYQNYTDTAKKNVADNNAGQILRYIKNQSGIAATGVATGDCDEDNVGACTSPSTQGASLPGYLETYFQNAGFTNPYSTAAGTKDAIDNSITLAADGDCTGDARGQVKITWSSPNLTINYCEGDELASHASDNVEWAN